jgi:hypothetical protein
MGYASGGSVVVVSLLALSAAFSPAPREAAQAAAPAPTPTPPVVAFSPRIPPEVPFARPAGYATLDPKNQPVFDIFSWKSFAAVNWPMTPTGNPLAAGFPFKNNQAPRQWEQWADPMTIFQPGWQPVCPGGRTLAAGDKVLHLMAKNSQILNPDGSFQEPDGNPLIDRNLNFALYEIRMNPDEVAYVTQNGLQTKAGQAAFASAKKTVAFPGGPSQYGPTGAIEVKAVWRILDTTKGDDPKRYYSRSAVVYVAAVNSDSGQPMCIDATVGLVGLHVIHKTKDFPQWIWSSWEHVDNAPTSPPSGGPPKVAYSFYSPGYRFYLPVNTPPTLIKDKKYFTWSATPPYAAKYARVAKDFTQLQFGSQVVRSNSIYPPTAAVTATWQQAMQGTPWANYLLLGSQWVGGDTPAETLAIPAQLANSAIETYIQDTASCVQCHSLAQTTASTTASPQTADFSFLLGLAQ